MPLRKDHSKHDLRESSVHHGFHGAFHGHPLLAVAGLIGAGMSAMMQHKDYYESERCGHRVNH